LLYYLNSTVVTINSLFIDRDALDDNSSRFLRVLLLVDVLDEYELLLSSDDIDVVELIELFFTLEQQFLKFMSFSIIL
jgi:hypothetical protein